MKDKKGRAQFVTRTGVIAATVGSAVGLGNIWRFPYEAGMHGGGAFLLIYLGCVFIVGLPVMLAEFVIGRSTHKGALGAIEQLAPGSAFKLVPYMGIVASLMILSFYSVVAGWILEYLWQSVYQALYHTPVNDYAAQFNTFVANPWRTLMWTLLFLTMNFAVLARGVQKGIERVSNLLMPLLFVILLVFCVNSLMLPGASEGLHFLFFPDFSAVSPSMVIGAMGQAFFSLSLGLACLLTYASYYSDRTPLIKSGVTIAMLDTLVAVMAGIIIFPAVFSYGMAPSAGPKLVFETLPAIFAQMPGGTIWAILFFILLFFASITSTISMSEISIAFFTDEWHMNRRRASALCIGIAMIVGSLCALSFGVLSDIKIFGKTIFDLLDYASSNILLPIGGVLLSAFTGWVVDRRIVAAQLSVNHPCPLWLLRTLRIAMRWIAPAAILTIFVYGLL